MNIQKAAMISLGTATVLSVFGLLFPNARGLVAGTGGAATIQ